MLSVVRRGSLPRRHFLGCDHVTDKGIREWSTLQRVPRVRHTRYRMTDSLAIPQCKTHQGRNGTGIRGNFGIFPAPPCHRESLPETPAAAPSRRKENNWHSSTHSSRYTFLVINSIESGFWSEIYLTQSSFNPSRWKRKNKKKRKLNARTIDTANTERLYDNSEKRAAERIEQTKSIEPYWKKKKKESSPKTPRTTRLLVNGCSHDLIPSLKPEWYSVSRKYRTRISLNLFLLIFFLSGLLLEKVCCWAKV